MKSEMSLVAGQIPIIIQIDPAGKTAAQVAEEGTAAEIAKETEATREGDAVEVRIESVIVSAIAAATLKSIDTEEKGVALLQDLDLHLVHLLPHQIQTLIAVVARLNAKSRDPTRKNFLD